MLCTSSSLKKVLPEFEAVLKLKVPIVSTTEELAYPVKSNASTAKRIDALAKRARVAVLGTGVNPGFVMDALPIALTGVCESVTAIEIDRIQDARIRRLPFQKKIGAGLTGSHGKVGPTACVSLSADRTTSPMFRGVPSHRRDPSKIARSVEPGLTADAGPGRAGGTTSRAADHQS